MWVMSVLIGGSTVILATTVRPWRTHADSERLKSKPEVIRITVFRIFGNNMTKITTDPESKAPANSGAKTFMVRFMTRSM